MAKRSESELARALARPDIEHLRAAVHAWHQYYVFAFNGGTRERPQREIPEELEPPDFRYFGYPRELAHDHIIACMMIALAETEDENFLSFWAWGDFWNMLHDADRTMLARIEGEARRTPRFRWMLAHLHLHGVPKVQEMLEQARRGAPSDGKMPPAPWV